MAFLSNAAWPQYLLEDQEKWPENGSLNYNTTLHLDLYCKRLDKWDEIPYVQCLMALYQNRGCSNAKRSPITRSGDQQREGN